MNDADELFERKEELVRLSENYSSFAGDAEGTKTQLKFIMKTDEIEKPFFPRFSYISTLNSAA